MPFTGLSHKQLILKGLQDIKNSIEDIILVWPEIFGATGRDYNSPSFQLQEAVREVDATRKLIFDSFLREEKKEKDPETSGIKVGAGWSKDE